MTNPKFIMIATIGTRDLIFQTSNGEWLNLGDDRTREKEEISHQQMIALDLGLPIQDYVSQYRKLTALLLEDEQKYQNRILPVMLGGLLREQSQAVSKIILVGTDQAESVPQRSRDTLHACELIRCWLSTQYPNLPVEIVTVGQAQENPSNFDSMFQWWSQFYREHVDLKAGESLWLSLKGGVGQMAEAGRIAALNSFGDQIRTIDYQEKPELNKQGEFSTVLEPSKGQFYLWDLTRKQAIALLERFDYDAAETLLKPYLDGNPRCSGIRTLLRAGREWNQARFDRFFDIAKGQFDAAQRQQSQEFWRYAYESLYLSVVRLKQQNLVEAMLHCFRGIEDLLTEYICTNFSQYVQRPKDRFPTVSPDIMKEKDFQPVQALREEFQRHKQRKADQPAEVKGYLLHWICCSALPALQDDPGFQAFWGPAYTVRNNIAHRVQGLSEGDFYNAWSAQSQRVASLETWDVMLTHSLNLVSGCRFRHAKQSSLFAALHHKLLKTLRELSLES